MAKRMLKATAVGSISALALAAMAGTASAQDNAGIDAYGFIHGSGTYHEEGDNDTDSFQFGASGTGSEGNLPSRFGVRGNMDLAPGITGVAQLELGVTDEQSEAGLYTRLANAGLQFEDVGTVRVGSQWTQHYLWTTSQTDVFTGAHHVRTGTAQTIFRQDNMGQFTSENFGGFQFAAGVQSARGDDEEADVLHGAAQYSTGPLTVAASVADQQQDDGLTTMAAGGTYDFGVAAVSLVVSQFDDEFLDEDWTNVEGAVTVPVAENWTLKGKVSNTEGNQDASASNYGEFDEDVLGYGAELGYNFGNGAEVYVGVGDDDEDEADNMIASTGVVVQF